MSIFEKVGSPILKSNCATCGGLLAIETPSLQSVHGTPGEDMIGYVLMLFSCMSCGQLHYAKVKEVTLKYIGEKLDADGGEVDHALVE